jgi:hypothetical protein
MLCHGPDSSNSKTKGSRRRMNVYEAVLVESRSTAIRNHAKACLSVVTLMLVPKKRKATIANETRLRRKKNVHGEW